MVTLSLTTELGKESFLIGKKTTFLMSDLKCIADTLHLKYFIGQSILLEFFITGRDEASLVIKYRCTESCT